MVGGTDWTIDFWSLYALAHGPLARRPTPPPSLNETGKAEETLLFHLETSRDINTHV